MYRNEVVGFDAREMWLDVDSQWSQKRRDMWQVKDEILLKLDVLKPLSVDNIVWHSVFSELHDTRLWNNIPRQAKYSGDKWNDVFSEGRILDWPDYYMPQGVFRNLASMQDYLK